MRPIALHPDNGHYFLFRNKPAILLSSAEHYGALLNLDFDYKAYVRELKRFGLNQSRVFSGAYREVAGNFNIASNTLAPKPERFCAPWPRTDTPGAADGLGKFDLGRWNDAYFRRLSDYCREAGRHGVVLELVLFCPFYEDNMWAVSPMNARNNVNGVGEMARTDVYTLKDAKMLAIHDALTRKLVDAVKGFDNVYFEIANEPYFGGITMEWQHHIADTITDAQRGRSDKHLIAQNIANGSAEIKSPHPGVSVFNFHYASPPDAVRVNYGLNRVIAFDETGFAGTDDATYRTQAWEFLLAGGGGFSHLDYSFTAGGHEDGTFAYPKTQPGGGSRALRAQYKILRDFMNGFDFLKMRPHNAAVAGNLPDGVRATALAEPGKTYALYLNGGGGAAVPLVLDVPAGRWRAEWLDPATGAWNPAPKETDHAGGNLALDVPGYTKDTALRLTRKGR
uniref:Uncharacterized protein n=1 Tax=uncultured Armatimonadetes bacterium TaxID=157466 RepID=A0A6J4HN43_9BACT|nr:hypothetical protein AVDCRST_MAG63-835 [uncultured Armatimonadetes bacterium]